MNSARAIRIIKRDQRQPQAAAAEPLRQKSNMAAESARKVKTVVSGWVRERQQRSADRPLTFANLFQKA